MIVKLRPNDELFQTDMGIWDSLGEDPQLLLHFGFVRKPHIVVWLRGPEVLLDVKLYINRGRGFREIDAVELPTASSIVVRLNVGSWGTIESLRIDPATFPTRFQISVESFASDADARIYADSLTGGDASARVADMGSLPRFWTMLPPISLRRRGATVVERYADAQYKLASTTVFKPEASDAPWLSIVVPIYNAPARYLDDLRRSFEGQKVVGTELILSDDGSDNEETLHWLEQVRAENITVIRARQNSGIAAATNLGIEQARGAWVGLLDHDDMLAPHALKVIGATLAKNPNVQFVYTDELVVNDRLRPTGAMLKPAYDPVLLSGMNYINHFSVYRRDRLQAIGNVRQGYDGSQDYDLLLRYLENVDDSGVLHLPYPAYWWRRNGHTYSRKFIDKATDNARRALHQRYADTTHDVELRPAITPTLHRIDWSRPNGGWPKVSVIIPSKNSFDLISNILSGLFSGTDYPELEVIVIDNGTTDQKVLDLYARFQAERPDFRAVVKPGPFNFARAINNGMELATGEHYLVLNNDIEVIEPGWLKEMVTCLNYPDTGIVGAKLLYPNGKLQHAGVVAGLGGLAGHWYLNMADDFGGPMNRLHVRNSMTCVTGAAMLVSGSCARDLGEWDETNFPVAYNDVDYCLRAYRKGWRTIWTPFAKLYHHESATRGADVAGERRQRFEREKAHLREKHHTTSFLDPALNPAESRDRSYPRLTVPAELANPRNFY